MVNKMRRTFFFLVLTRPKDDKSVLEVDHKLKKPIHDARMIKVLQWDVTFGLDYVMCPLLGGSNETNDSSADMPVLAFGQGGVGTNHEVVPIDQSNSTINRLIIRMKKPNNEEYPRERIHMHLVIFHE